MASRNTRPKGHKHWQCPGKHCGATYISPIPISAVCCPRSENHSKKGAVLAMRPTEETSDD